MVLSVDWQMSFYHGTGSSVQPVSNTVLTPVICPPDTYSLQLFRSLRHRLRSMSAGLYVIARMGNVTL